MRFIAFATNKNQSRLSEQFDDVIDGWSGSVNMYIALLEMVDFVE